MKDQRGLYYYPFPQNKRVRMYVRRSEEDVEFRLWNQDDPELWTQHGWIAYGAVRQASNMYGQNRSGGFNPEAAYDLSLAKTLLNDDR
jgi:hypothetical protein